MTEVNIDYTGCLQDLILQIQQNSMKSAKTNPVIMYSILKYFASIKTTTLGCLINCCFIKTFTSSSPTVHCWLSVYLQWWSDHSLLPTRILVVVNRWKLPTTSILIGEKIEIPSCWLFIPQILFWFFFCQISNFSIKYYITHNCYYMPNMHKANFEIRLSSNFATC